MSLFFSKYLTSNHHSTIGPLPSKHLKFFMMVHSYRFHLIGCNLLISKLETSPEVSQVDGLMFFVIAWSRISMIGLFVQNNSLNQCDHMSAYLEQSFGSVWDLINVIGVIDVIMWLGWLGWFAWLCDWRDWCDWCDWCDYVIDGIGVSCVIDVIDVVGLIDDINVIFVIDVIFVIVVICKIDILSCIHCIAFIAFIWSMWLRQSLMETFLKDSKNRDHVNHIWYSLRKCLKYVIMPITACIFLSRNNLKYVITSITISQISQLRNHVITQSQKNHPLD